MRKPVLFYLLLILLSASSYAAESDAVVLEPEIIIHDIADFSIGKNLSELDIAVPDF